MLLRAVGRRYGAYGRCLVVSLLSVFKWVGSNALGEVLSSRNTRENSYCGYDAA